MIRLASLVLVSVSLGLLSTSAAAAVSGKMSCQYHLSYPLDDGNGQYYSKKFSLNTPEPGQDAAKTEIAEADAVVEIDRHGEYEVKVNVYKTILNHRYDRMREFSAGSFFSVGEERGSFLEEYRSDHKSRLIWCTRN